MLEIKRIPYQQMIIGLDKLLFQGSIRSQEDAENILQIVEAYLEGCGYTWNNVIDEMLNEEVASIPTKDYN